MELFEKQMEHFEKQMEHVEKQMEHVEKQMEHVEKQMEHVEKQMEHFENPSISISAALSQHHPKFAAANAQARRRRVGKWNAQLFLGGQQVAKKLLAAQSAYYYWGLVFMKFKRENSY